VATVSDTDWLRATDREPRLALSLALERTVAGLPSVAELASLIGVVTMIFELADPDGALRAAVRRPLTVEHAHPRGIQALAVVEHDGAPLIITAGEDGALRSWRLDGSLGELTREHAHHDEITALVVRISALAVVEYDGAPLIISAGDDGALRSWRVGPRAWTRLGGPLAAQLEVRRLSLGSLELEVLVPAVSAVPAALGFVLYAFKRLWTFQIELRIHRAQMRARLMEAERELERLEATGEVDDVVEAARDVVIEAWNVLDATLSEDDDTGG
jgi:hypothetical protein